jgi:hypothetical protein
LQASAHGGPDTPAVCDAPSRVSPQACAAPDELVEAIRGLDVGALRPYARGSTASMVAAIDALMGVA